MSAYGPLNTFILMRQWSQQLCPTQILSWRSKQKQKLLHIYVVRYSFVRGQYKRNVHILLGVRRAITRFSNLHLNAYVSFKIYITVLLCYWSFIIRTVRLISTSYCKILKKFTMFKLAFFLILGIFNSLVNWDLYDNKSSYLEKWKMK